jgi:hypothetical protein
MLQCQSSMSVVSCLNHDTDFGLRVTASASPPPILPTVAQRPRLWGSYVAAVSAHGAMASVLGELGIDLDVWHDSLGAGRGGATASPRGAGEWRRDILECKARLHRRCSMTRAFTGSVRRRVHRHDMSVTVSACRAVLGLRVGTATRHDYNIVRAQYRARARPCCPVWPSIHWQPLCSVGWAVGTTLHILPVLERKTFWIFVP